MSFNVVIPARYSSSRLPGKPLIEIAGVPMVIHVARKAKLSGADEIIIATDDERIVPTVKLIMPQQQQYFLIMTILKILIMLR